MALGDSNRAARLVEAAKARRVETGSPLPPIELAEFEEIVTLSRQALGDAAFEAAEKAGSLFSVEDAVVLALSDFA